MSTKPVLYLSGNDLTCRDIVAIGLGEKEVALDKEATARCQASRAFLEQAVRDRKIICGVNTSYGPMCNKTGKHCLRPRRMSAVHQ